ncbi:MAG: YigZ family protein [Clostridia bacterium]|nr:YigZ family protein [Clostridia bacterium]
MKEYRTINGNFTAEYTEKHSRFIATAFYCETEEQASEIIAAQKSKYWDARHNVYAYILQNGTARFSDDGEPHGTAGMPVLDVIKGSGITNVLIVVTRYFGGTLLGTGGLVRAYSTSARDALCGAQKVLMCVCQEYTIDCDYGNYDKLVRLITDHSCMVQSTDFTDKVTVNVVFKKVDCDTFLNKLCEIFASKIEAELKDELFFPFYL